MFRTLAKLGGKGPFSGLDIGAIEFYGPDLPYKHHSNMFVSPKMAKLLPNLVEV